MSQNLSMKTSLETKDDANQDIKQQPKLYAKDSLDRYGDDLFGLLLTHLSLEDRFRLESVSKQFGRTVFLSVVDIKIGDKVIQKCLKYELLATIARKCPNIQTIDCQEECPQLVAHVLNTFGSLIHLTTKSVSNVFDMTSGQLLAKNLQTFDVTDETNTDNQLLTAFVSGNASLKSVSMDTRHDLWQLSTQLSRLTKLRELRLRLFLGKAESLSQCLHTIGLNCKQLQRLTLQLNFFSGLNEQTLDSLRFYPRLKRLNLSHFGTNSDVLTPLRFCHLLTHLTLDLCPISGKLFINCDKHWPKLQYLRICNHTIPGLCLSYISRLPALQTLKLYVMFRRDNDLCDLLSTNLKCFKVYTNKVVSLNFALKYQHHL